jgi:hypothetical protein
MFDRSHVDDILPSKLEEYMKEFEEDMNYTILDRSRIKISALGKHPLFPNESIDLLRFTLEITRENEKTFINDATIELLLMFGNKTDKLSFSLKEHFRKD